MEIIKDILRGILIGVANIIPGVSGGTMMVSMGIYDEIIKAINNFFREFVKSIKFIFPYAVGMAIGIVGFSFFIEYLFESYPIPTASAFVGLILGGIPIISKRVRGKKASFKEITAFIVFFALIIFIQKLDVIMEYFFDIKKLDYFNELSIFSVIILFVLGVVAAAAMVIPGVSGSMILMALGYYNAIIETINSFVKSLIRFDIMQMYVDAFFLLPFGIGVLVGIFGVARFIEFLLRNHERITIYSIMGLVMASPIAVFMSIQVQNFNIASIVTAVFTFIVGFVCAFKLGAKSD